MKHSKKWGVHSFQIDGQAFTSSYEENVNLYEDFFCAPVLALHLPLLFPAHPAITAQGLLSPL